MARGGEDLFKTVLKLAEKAGEELAEFGKISDETSKKLIKETTQTKEEIEAFQNGANQYWKSQQPKEVDQSKISVAIPDDAKLLDISSGGTDTFFAGMARLYKPTGKYTSKGIIQFDLDDESWFIAMDGKSAKAYKGRHPSPSSTVVSPLDLWMDVSSGKKNGESEFMKGSYKIKGDMTYLTDMGEIFVTEDSDVSNDSVDNNETIPQKRGLLNLSGMAWMQVAFIPWIVIWVFGSIFPGLVPRFIAAGLSLVILLYHSITNKSTLFEFGTASYLVTMSVLLSLNLSFATMYIWVIDYVFLGALWLGSSINRFSLTAEYSAQGFSKPVLESKAFKATNIILSCVWGLFFLLEALIMLVEMSYPGIAIVLMIVRYTLLVPMFVFTNWFQKWYPEKILSDK
ncbi:MAG: SCP2 sterol-binding domain-containing protein [Caldisericia bacterium]